MTWTDASPGARRTGWLCGAVDMVSIRNIYTIGHSTHELSAFLSLLTPHGITAVADVRSDPFSRDPCYNHDSLAAALRRVGIEYVFLGRELGARREEHECYVDGQAVYERVAQLPLFREGIARLIDGTEHHRISLMCAEKEPLDCHRTILVCRNLRPYGLHIQHILSDGTLEEHSNAEKRLMRLMGMVPDLFRQDAEQLIEEAYEARGRQIAYRTSTEEVAHERVY